MNQIPLKPANSHYTDSQWQSIYATGDNYLVSASAGSGKTTVLVERVIEQLLAGTRIDELLIVTFTEAAAKEMKERIQVALQHALNQATNAQLRQHLVQQLTLLPTASISTLHAFCLQVVRRYYYLIKLDPVFRLLTDETEIILLKEDVWDDLRELLYEEEQTIFYQLTENFSNDRSDEGLTNLIFSLHQFAQANPNPDQWLEQLADYYQLDSGLADNPLYREIIFPRISEKLQTALKNYTNMLLLAEQDPELEKVCILAREEKAIVNELHRLLKEDQLDDMYHLLKDFSFSRYPTIKRSADEIIKEKNQELKQLRDSAKSLLVALQKEFFAFSPEYLVQLTEDAQPIVREMISVAKRFSQAYANRKMERQLLDFNDLEHFTLKILATCNEEGIWSQTEASRFYRDRFKEILVDEYQDINGLQESILYWLRKPETEQGNFFMVGDVKQSIYAFRLADPTLFIEKYQRYASGDTGQRIILAENFRSRPEILTFTNLLFAQLMDNEVGQLDYDQAAHLINGYQDFPDSQDYQPELLLFETGIDGEDSIEEADLFFTIDDRTQGELRVVGQKIQQLIKTNFPIYDKKQKAMRPVTYRDIVLLTPTKKNNLVLLDIFKEMDIPLQVNDAQNYFQATEIRFMVALLQIIDNPDQDIPLAAVLRSPIVGLKENELAYIRLLKKKSSYYRAFQALLRTKPEEVQQANYPELLSKVQKFADLLEKWREQARRNELVQLIWTIYLDTGILDYVGGLPAGNQRQANLHALYERAASYEETSYKGLYQFVRFIEKMQEKDKDLAEPTVLQSENAVRVMTIHASKGLEFPIVFVLDLSKQFNLSDLRERYLFDAHLGAGIQYLESNSRILYPTLPYLAVAEQKKRKLLAEEMRKLYVALTRAEQKLYLVGSCKNAEAAWQEWSRAAQTDQLVLTADDRLASNTLLHWIGMSLIRHPAAVGQRPADIELPTPAALTNYPISFMIQFTNLEQLQVTATEQLQEKIQQLDNQQLDLSANEQQAFKQSVFYLDYQYPYSLATQTSSYQSVSELKRLYEDPDDKKLDLTTAQTVNRFVQEKLNTPKFVQTVRQPSAAEIGTATHLLLQRLDLKKQPTEMVLARLKTELCEQGILSEDVLSLTPDEQILGFFTSQLGKQLIQHAEAVVREQPFSMLVPASQLYPDFPSQISDDVLVHGMIDGYLETENELILFDYKTDSFSPDDPSEQLKIIVEKYRSQLMLYRRALELARQREVTNMYLILLREGQIIDLVEKNDVR